MYSNTLNETKLKFVLMSTKYQKKSKWLVITTNNKELSKRGVQASKKRL